MGKSGNPAKAALQAAPDITTTETDHDSVEDFDAFWSMQDRKRPATTIMGQRVELPASLPLQFEMEARRLQRSRKDKDVRKLVAILFGQDQYERWAEAGMDLEQFMVLLAWAPAVIAGQPVTLAEVAAKVRAKLEAERAGETEGDDADPS